MALPYSSPFLSSLKEEKEYPSPPWPTYSNAARVDHSTISTNSTPFLISFRIPSRSYLRTNLRKEGGEDSIMSFNKAVSPDEQ